MKNNSLKLLLTISLAIFLFGMAACSAAPDVIETSANQAANDSMIAYEGENTAETVQEAVAEEAAVSAETSDLAASSGLTDVEISGLIFMREEEKLARDVYLTLYDFWNLNIFRNIASSEQTHTDAVKDLLVQYGISDPVSTDEIGVFANADLQALYDQLVDQGSQSLSDALHVGAAIEEIDILDLEEYIAQTDNPDIHLVYENLMKGSRNHLRSFVSTISQQTGITYAPQYLSEEVYLEIVGTGIESGGQGGRFGNN